MHCATQQSFAGQNQMSCHAEHHDGCGCGVTWCCLLDPSHLLVDIHLMVPCACRHRPPWQQTINTRTHAGACGDPRNTGVSEAHEAHGSCPDPTRVACMRPCAFRTPRGPAAETLRRRWTPPVAHVPQAYATSPWAWSPLTKPGRIATAPQPCACRVELVVQGLRSPPLATPMQAPALSQQAAPQPVPLQWP